MLIYIAGPYSGDVDNNIAQARAVAVELWRKGHAVICPHLNSAHMEQDAIAWDVFIEGDLKIIARVDALVMLPGWENSRGSIIEYDYAKALNIPIWFAPDLPELHPVEVRCPRQVKGFAETLGKMYRIHLSKNSDYSPANILGTGEIGLVTRLWDKTARMLNLLGFRIKIESCRFDSPKEPQHEAIADTYLDLANYGVIGLLLRQGDWGR